MGLDIDITEKQSHEIIEILNNYPRGHLENKFERVFWVSDSSVPTRVDGPESPPGHRGASNPRNQSSLGDRFQNMADNLGSMMGPPPPQRPR